MDEARPLDGLRIGVTSSRRLAELVDLLERRGATCECAPALTIVPCADDTLLRQATKDCIGEPPDYLIANTGAGMRGWLDAAREWGLLPDLVSALLGTSILARGPKAVGAVRAAGLRESWATDTESLDEILAHLRGKDLAGRRIVLQEHGMSTASVAAALHRQGAQVSVLSVYRCVAPADLGPLFRLVDLVADRDVHAVTFTVAAAVQILMDVASAAGRQPEVLEAFRTDVAAACVGPVTATPFRLLGVPTVQPARYRLAALVRTMEADLPRRAQGTTIAAAGHVLTIRGDDVTVDGTLVRLTPAPLGVLRALAETPGRVVTRADLKSTLPRGQEADEHAVEAAVARLRASVGSDLVVTVLKRGYRLAADP